MSALDSSVHSAAEQLLAVRLAHPIRVAVDGRTASGKTTLADKLAVALRRSDRPVIRASIDDFHQHSAVRHRKGRMSAEGYYDDARNLQAFKSLLLDPLGPDGDLNYVTKAFDLAGDVPVHEAQKHADPNAILVVDGTFLQRPELQGAWDFVIFLDLPAEEALRRGIARDAAKVGGKANATTLHQLRYAPASDRYIRECRPAERADLVIDAGLE